MAKKEHLFMSSMKVKGDKTTFTFVNSKDQVILEYEKKKHRLGFSYVEVLMVNMDYYNITGKESTIEVYRDSFISTSPEEFNERLYNLISHRYILNFTDGKHYLYSPS